jgi:hypothetical protein
MTSTADPGSFRKLNIKSACFVLIASIPMLGCASALAQQYPTKPIRIVMTSGPDALPRASVACDKCRAHGGVDNQVTIMLPLLFLSNRPNFDPPHR